MKESAIADHLVDLTVEDYESLNFDIPNEDVLTIKDSNEMKNWWTLYFDGAEVVIISQKKKKSNTLFL